MYMCCYYASGWLQHNRMQYNMACSLARHMHAATAATAAAAVIWQLNDGYPVSSGNCRGCRTLESPSWHDVAVATLRAAVSI
jgi:hypothetical protein